MRRRAFLAVIMMLAVMLVGTGCSGNRKLQARLMQMARVRQPETEYIVAPPDVLMIDVRGYPEYSRSMAVRPDGRITVPAAGEVCVQGRTLPEITEMVRAELSKELAQPTVTVSLVTANSKAIFVLGEVRRPGSQPYFGDMNLIDAVGTAGGLTLYADAGAIKLTRASLDRPDVIRLNLRELVYKGRAEQNVPLQNGDIIYVPPTALATVGYAMDQLLFPFRAILGGFATYGNVRDAFEDNP